MPSHASISPDRLARLVGTLRAPAILRLDIDSLRRIATIVRGTDTDRPDLAPEAAGLLAASLDLSRGHADDVEQLDAGVVVYDAFYRWCRDATEETHDRPAHQGRSDRR